MSVITCGVLWSIIAFCSIFAKGENAQPPNIVLILADDMGWNDVSFHGSDQIPTPNIDALAYNGIILNQHYTPALCTPSRAALLTGKYPIHTGMQHLVILESEPWGLGLGERILPEALSRAGYRSHAIGKWHLGFYKKEYTPTFRGFQSHFGYWQGFHDYYNHSVRATYEPFDGYDMRRNLDVDWSSHGKYSTDLFTEEAVNLIKDHNVKEPLFLYLAHLAPHTGNMRDPFQAPDPVVAKFSHIEDPERRTYAAMVAKLDESVGEVVTALRQKGMLENSIIIFLSDNGAPTIGIHSNRGSNYPFRGIKNSAWEGGNRGVAAVWSPLLRNQKRVSDQLMYITDWLPTLYSAAGLDPKDLGNIDGVDMWSALSEGGPSPRNEILYNIDNIGNPYAALRIGKWKYIKGSATGIHLAEWYGESGRDSGIEYNTKAIMLSKTGVAISAFVIKNQIQQKIKRENEENSALEKGEMRHWSPLTERDILRLRKKAEIECPTFNMTDLTTECQPLEEPCLFNLDMDPCEKVNLAYQHPDILEKLELAVQRFRQTMLPARNQESDSTADPRYWNSTWSCWQDEASLEADLFRLGIDSNTLIWGTIVVLCLILLSVVVPFLFPSNKVEPDNSKFLSIFSLDPPGQSKDMSPGQK